jgi:GAF domain
VGADPAERAREIGRAHAAFLVDDKRAGARPVVREVVKSSWLRSAQAHVDPDAEPPVILLDDDLVAYRAAHRLAEVIDVLRDLLGSAAGDGGHLMAVSDAGGRLLWVEGDRGARRQAEAINFVEGAVWDEAHAGTNAPGTALAVDQPVQIFATEHFRHPVQSWTCAAAPIHDPATGQILGVVDITGGDVVAHPHSLALVRAAALAAEAQLAWHRSGPANLWVHQSQAQAQARFQSQCGPARLEALGRADGILRRDGRETRLGRRHTEIMIILSAHPEGLSGEQLADALYHGPTAQTTLRVELNRLRHIVGDLLRSRPYRLAGPIEADFLEVAAALRRGDTAAAAAAYHGPLLPSSEAPGVEAQRRWLDARLRSTILADADPAVLAGFAERFGFDDLQLWERLAALTPAGSPRRAVAAARVAQLRADYGLGAR